MNSSARRLAATLPALALVGLMAAWTLWHGLAVLRADMVSAAARQNVNDWALDGQGWDRQTWKDTRQALLSALEITPDDPALHDYLAQLYITQGVVAWDIAEQREAFFAEALDHLLASLRLRPEDGRTWASVAQARYALGQPTGDIQQAWQQARKFAPREATVQQALASLVLGTWDQATPDMRGWLRQQWLHGTAPVRAALLEDAKRFGQPQALE